MLYIILYFFLVSNRIVQTFVRCTTLLKPLLESTKIKLIGDIAHIETLLHLIINKRKTNNHIILTHLKDLLFISNETLSEFIYTHALHTLGGINIITYLFISIPLSNSSPLICLQMNLSEWLYYIDTHTISEIYIQLHLIYERIENSIQIPKGPSGLTFLNDNYPRLTLISKLLPKPGQALPEWETKTILNGDNQKHV
jgi:hypothetical protein